MAHRDIIVVGASAGGIAPLKALAAGLPRDFAASIFPAVDPLTRTAARGGGGLAIARQHTQRACEASERAASD